jgi:hypothetical protein
LPGTYGLCCSSISDGTGASVCFPAGIYSCLSLRHIQNLQGQTFSSPHALSCRRNAGRAS